MTNRPKWIRRPVEGTGAREAIAVRYLIPEGGRAFADCMDGARSALFTIRPDRWVTQDYYWGDF
jgi:hypothetical protein